MIDGIIDLVLDDDGSYSQRETKYSKKKDTGKITYIQHKNADEFLAGLDAGLDFVEGMKKRIDRALKLKD
jgi:hypothetical protein